MQHRLNIRQFSAPVSRATVGKCILGLTNSTAACAYCPGMSVVGVTIPDSPLVVGSVDHIDQLAALESASLPGCCDVLEVRLDGMAGQPADLDYHLDRLSGLPMLFTSRCASQGGIGRLSPAERAQQLLSVSARASWIDVEIASYQEMASVVEEIRAQGVGLILSHHDFDKTPSESEIQGLIDICPEAEIIKLAFFHHGVQDLMNCCNILRDNDHPMAVMGMGKLGPVSRLLYAQHGALLNYGYLGDKPTAPGQWSAEMLKDAIAALEPID